jgi:hypothetical protein
VEENAKAVPSYPQAPDVSRGFSCQKIIYQPRERRKFLIIKLMEQVLKAFQSRRYVGLEIGLLGYS